jgi:hypothetical protein
MAQKTFTDSPTKFCPSCKQEKAREEFNKSSFTKHGLSVYCKPCTVARHETWRKNNLPKAAAESRKWREAHPRESKDHIIRRRYGLPLGSYEKMLAEQEGKCACCGSSDPGGRDDFHVDHCHDTNAIRGLLCHGCNVGIGYFKHDVTRLQSAITYLTQNSN